MPTRHPRQLFLLLLTPPTLSKMAPLPLEANRMHLRPETSRQTWRLRRPPC